MNFRYLDSSSPNGTTSKRPYVLVRFFHNDKELEQYALIDSGADMSAMDYRYAAKLGLDLTGRRVKTFGVSGPVESVVTRIYVEISKGHEHYVYEIPIRVLFSETEFFAPTLLGRQGFFDKFVITIDESEQKIKLKHNGQE